MVRNAHDSGATDEGKMWLAVQDLGQSLEMIKDKDPDLYWHIMRRQHGILYDRHYCKEFAEYDVSQIAYTNAKGEERNGAHWTRQQIVEATKGRPFPSRVNDYDKYVAYNVAYSDLCKSFDDAQILEAAYMLYFADEDWGSGKDCTKIWDYMCLHDKVKG